MSLSSVSCCYKSGRFNCPGQQQQSEGDSVSADTGGTYKAGWSNGFPTTGHFIALINRAKSTSLKPGREKKLGAFLHSILTACSAPLPGFSADLLGESVILHKLVLLPLIQSILHAQSRAGEGSAHCHFGFKVDVK